MENQENQQFTKKERKVIRKEEKGNQLETEKKQRDLKKTIRWVVILAIIFGALFLIAKTVSRERENLIENLPGQFFQEQGKAHINPGIEHEPYNSNPPTSGSHWSNPANAGIYDEELPDEQLVHNLEHSHIWISYKPDLDSDTIEKLEKIAKDFGSKIVVTPRSKNDSVITLAAWQYLLKLDNFNEQAINDFIKVHRGKSGPESIPNSASEQVKDFRKK